MSINSIKKIWIIASILTIISGVCLYISEINLKKSIKGDLIFANIANDINIINKVVIKTSDKLITAYNDENLWRILEADNYYANFNKIHKLLENIASAKIGKKVEGEIVNQLQWYSIVIYDHKENELSKAEIGKKANSDTNYVRLADNNVYITTWNTSLPNELSSWTRQPLLSFSSKEISEFSTNNESIYRYHEGDEFFNSQSNRQYKHLAYTKIFDILKALNYEEVLSSQEFNDTKYSQTTQQTLTTFDGLVTQLQYFTNGEEYWVKISLSTTALPSNKVRDYIKDNSIFYEDWWFRLLPSDGQSLFTFVF